MIVGTGPYVAQGLYNQSAYNTYAYYSGVLTTTDSFEDTILDFGIGLGQIYIINTGSHSIAFQFPEFYVATGAVLNTACGIVLSNDKTIFRNMFNKRGMKIRSLVDGSQSTVYVFGI